MDKDDKNVQHIVLHKAKKPWYKRFWFWALVVIVLLAIAAASGNKTNTNTTTDSTATPAKSQDTQWDLEAAYTKIQNGMSKAQVEEPTGKKSESCTESQSDVLGKSEVCTYGNAFTDKGSIMVTFMDDKVSSKTKSTY